MSWFSRLFGGRSGADPAVADMPSVLAWLGIPLVGSASDGALTGGVAKAGIYEAHVAIESGDPDVALAHLDAVLGDPGLRHPGNADMAAAAFALRGRAHEANGHPMPAAVAYRQAAELNPHCGPAVLALERIESGP